MRIAVEGCQCRGTVCLSQVSSVSTFFFFGLKTEPEELHVGCAWITRGAVTCFYKQAKPGSEKVVPSFTFTRIINLVGHTHTHKHLVKKNWAVSVARAWPLSRQKKTPMHQILSRGWVAVGGAVRENVRFSMALWLYGDLRSTGERASRVRSERR